MGVKNHNHIGRVFDIKLSEEVKYKKLGDLKEGKNYPCAGFYISTKSKFGPSPCLIMDKDTVINLPSGSIDRIKELLSDEEAVEEINQGIVVFRVTSYESKTFKRTCYDFELDIEE